VHFTTSLLTTHDTLVYDNAYLMWPYTYIERGGREEVEDSR